LASEYYWEHTVFRMALPALRQTALWELDEPFPTSEIMQAFWQQVEADVLKAIQPWLDRGWQPMAAIGPDCLEVDHQREGSEQVIKEPPPSNKPFIAKWRGWLSRFSSERDTTRYVYTSTLKEFCIDLRRKVEITDTNPWKAPHPVEGNRFVGSSEWSWEYKEFRMQLRLSRQTVVVKSGDHFPETAVLYKFWAEVKDDVKKALQPWLDDGWHSTTKIGLNCLVIDIKKMGKTKIEEDFIPVDSDTMAVIVFMMKCFVFLFSLLGQLPSWPSFKRETPGYIYTATLREFRMHMRRQVIESDTLKTN
jgi:hypothetical protein